MKKTCLFSFCNIHMYIFTSISHSTGLFFFLFFYYYSFSRLFILFLVHTNFITTTSRRQNNQTDNNNYNTKQQNIAQTKMHHYQLKNELNLLQSIMIFVCTRLYVCLCNLRCSNIQHFSASMFV